MVKKDIKNEDEDVDVDLGEDASSDTKTEDKKPKKKIEVDADLLQELINSNKEMKQEIIQLGANAVANTNQSNFQVRRKIREFDYTIRKWDGKVVVGFENVGTEKRPLYVYDIYNENDRKNIQYVNLLIKGGKEIIKKIDYITFLRDAERIKARKVSQVEKEDTKEYGMIPKKEMAENGFGMYETMVMVPVEVTSKTYEITLKLPEDEGGDEVVINSEWLNM